jgi:nucleoside phosphorylase
MQKRVGRLRRAVAIAIAVGLASVSGAMSTTSAGAAPAPTPPCGHPILVLAAMPLELYPLIQRASVDPADVVHVNDRTFYVGRLGGNDVVMAMTGIGLVNAAETATAAFEHFRCKFTGAVFSGVAGSKSFIGDVNVPQRWTLDGGTSWLATNAKMFATARALQGTPQVALAQDVPVGDAACLCAGVDAATPVHLPYVPQLRVGGSGTSADTFGGHAVPCLPGGGDIAGCEPCLAPGSTPTDAANFAANAPSLADTAFFEALLGPPDPTTSTMDAQDEETASVASIARQYRVPFLGIRAVSDGQGDPLHLPGFPWQFFVYRQLAGNNAATVTIAFLNAWAAKRWPV